MSFDCPSCGRKWPYSKAYGTCKACSVPCVTSKVGQAMSLKDAAFEEKVISFATYYERREARRVGPSPEDRGREEAGEIIYWERRLRVDPPDAAA